MNTQSLARFTRMPFRSFGILTIIICLFAACANMNVVKLVDTNFKEQIDEKQNLVFRFNKDIISDSLLSADWDTTRYIRFEPEVAGSFKWNNTKELVFSPAEGFEPGVNYKATLTDELLSKSSNKALKLGKERDISFHTSPIKVSEVHSFWTKGRQGANVMVQMDITFNYETDIAQAASKLSLSINGRPVQFNNINNGTDKVLSIQFEPVAENDKDIDIKATLAKGVIIAGSNIATNSDTTFSATINSRHSLAVMSSMGQHDGTTGTINIALSQPVSEQDLKKLIEISPKVNFEVQATDGGFNISSQEFNPKISYSITLNKTMAGAYGGKFSEDKVVQTGFGELEPAINFINAKGMYLSSKGYRNLALNIVQVPELKVTVIKVYENNILQLFRQGNDWDSEYDEVNDRYQDYQYYRTENLGDTVFTQKYNTDKLPKNNAAHLLHLDFSDKLRGYDGVYIIQIESTRQRWIQSSKIVSLSDIGLIAKQEQNKIMVFANSIRNATPVSGAKITFISATNQPVYTTTTDKDGMAVMDEIDQKASGMRIGMVSAKQDEEYSFITFRESRIETSRYDVGGRNVNASGLNAWIYAERNLYRPGETIHASAIVRNESWMPPGEMPVKFRLLMPNGKEFANKKLMLNNQGSIVSDFAIPYTALTGTYVLQLLSGNDVLLSTYNFSIEDFMPDRIKVDLKLPKEQFELNEMIVSKIQADNLFGTPAANRKYEWELNLNKTDFSPKGYEDYTFRVVKNFYFSTVFKSGSTAGDGSATETFTLNDSKLSETGLLKGNIRTTVFDETGRPVHRYASFDVYTQPTFFGIKNFDDYVNTGVPLKINLAALDKSGSPKNTTAVVRMVRKEWQNVIEQNGSRYQYVSRWTEKDLGSSTINISGNNTLFTFTPDQSGQYEIQVSAQGSSSYVARSFYAYGMGNTQYSSFEVNNEGNVTIKSDKESYAPGENISLLFTTPFEGRMLVTIERNKVLEHHFLNTNNKSASLKIKASETFLPNVYVSATLFRAMDGSEMPLTVAHGYRNVKVEAQQNKIPVAVKMTEKSRSKSRQTINVKTVPNAYVTIAAVDEGILQVKNYKTPDPYAYFYQKVALSVNSFDVYPLLLPEYRITSSSTGGDGSANDMSGRVNPLFVNRVKNVSFWSGILKADANGNVHYEIDVPQFSGAIRVMAVAYKDKGFGSFDNQMKVADPIIISTALPRFLSPGDQTIMPVTISNTTISEAKAQVNLSLEGPLNSTQSQSQSVNIKANSEGRAIFYINADKAIGAGKVTVSVNALNETFSNETEIAVRPPASLQKDYVSGVIQAGNTLNLNLSNSFIPSTFKGTLVVSNSPLTQFSKNISYLVQYPYGCVEQTTAAAFPQLYYGDLVKVLENGSGEVTNANYNVQQAIFKLQAMQLPNGSLSYWPGGNYDSWWGSVFAAHFLIEARTAGFEVNETSLNRLIDYLKFRLKKKEVITYYYNGNKRKTIAAKEIPYSLYVLALARKPEQSIMNYYKGNTESLGLDGRYLLGAAYTLSGQSDKARQILPPAFSGEQSDPQFGGSFYSYIRDKAVALNALLDVNPKDPQVSDLARQLSNDMSTNPYLNTQENAFGILAMGKLARLAGKTNGEAQVMINGKSVAATKGQSLSIDLKQHLNSTVGIKTSGTGQFYYFRELSGLTADGKVKEEDKYIKVRRSFYSRSGEPITNNVFRQNDLIVIKITIESQYRSEIENVVITDMLPAGLEIENTRLNDMPNLKWVTDVKDKDFPDYMDIRDDRLNIFTSVSGKAKTFYYMVRAVSPGVYKLGPIQADAMYNGMFHSYHGAGMVRVEI